MEFERLVIYYDKKRNLIYSLASFIMAAASLLLVFTVFKLIPYPAKAILDIVLIAGFLFFGYGFIFFLLRVIKSGEMLVVDEHGVTDFTSAISLGFIPWSDIENAYIGGAMNNRFIELTLKNEAEYLSDLPLLKKLFILANKKLGYQVVCITLNTTSHSPDEVLEIINKYMNWQPVF